MIPQAGVLERRTIVPARKRNLVCALRRLVLVVLAHAFDAQVGPGWLVGHALGVLGERFLALPVLQERVGFGPQRAAEHFELQTARLLLRFLAPLSHLADGLVSNLGGIGGELNQE